MISKTIQKLSPFGKHSGPRQDSGRKSFFSLAKTPKLVLRPCSSTSSLSKPTRQIIDSPAVFGGDASPWREYSARIMRRPSFEAFHWEQSPEVQGQFDLESIHPSDSFSESLNDSPHPDASQPQFHHMSHLTLPETNLPATIKATMPKSRSPKFIVRRHKSMGTCRKKGVQWRQFIKSSKKKTFDYVTVALPHARSSPNLKLAEVPQIPEKDISEDEASCSHRDE